MAHSKSNLTTITKQARSSQILKKLIEKNLFDFRREINLNETKELTEANDSVEASLKVFDSFF